ncbi:winged helix-turn-helix domain-containing protein [Jeongeupia chitinilytica]|uniref:OmpR/PhoB-type domain-containing protein n=1 Tax=Jeongeupia chitinilytica TaxID=1041641 RepID=A0ABQ3GXC6_9NEIS|nr:helix-turn-helix domain-containing protein [Jeongeupia chitinilytica]GHD56928.1 hypothetical protein GCM10007350_04840 [Jeongeupia chitinilytica]
MNFYVKGICVSGSRLLFGSFEFQPELRYLTLHTQSQTETRVRLSGAEARILAHLLDHPGQICSKDALVAIGWQGKPISASSLAVAISTLRRHLQTVPPEVEIHNQPRQGYLLTLLVGLKAEFRPAAVEAVAIPAPAGPLHDPPPEAAPAPARPDTSPVLAATPANDARRCRWRAINLICLVLLLVTLLVSYHEWIDVDCTQTNGKWVCAVDNHTPLSAQTGPVQSGSVVLISGRMVNVVNTNQQAQP